MHSSSILVLLSAVATLVAAKTTTSINQAEALCSEALDNYVAGIPSAPTKLLDAVATNTNVRRPESTGDVCNIAWPTEVQSDIRAYGSSVLAWYSVHESSISSLFSQCPDATAYGYVSSCANRWATYSAMPNTASATATATETTSTSKHASKTKGTATPTSSSEGSSKTKSASKSSVTTPASSENPSTFTTSTPTSSSTSSSSAEVAATSSVQGGGAVKETGMKLAAVAVAGLVIVATL